MERLRDVRYYCEQHLRSATTKTNVGVLTKRLQDTRDAVIDEGMRLSDGR